MSDPKAVHWGTFETPDGRRHRQIEVSEESDWTLFETIAQRLEESTAGVWTSQLDGPDQRYWDLRVGPAKITLHLEHYLGITLYATDGADADPESEALLERVFDVLGG